MRNPETFQNLIAWTAVDILLICTPTKLTLTIGFFLFIILIINWRNYINNL